MGLFERELEVAALRRELSLLAEQGRAATVSGEAGSGKTALVAAVLDTDAERPRILRGLCDPLGTPRPLGPIRDVLGTVESDPERRLLSLLGEQPSVLVIEDAQWIDAASVEVLRHLVRRIERIPVCLIVTYRDGDVGLGHPLLPLLGDIARSDHPVHVGLQPLSVEAVSRVLADTSLDAAAAHALTGGNPFYVAEIARHPTLVLPPTVRDAVIASTYGLDADGIALLQLIAAAPDALDDRLMPALGIDLPSLRRVEATGLLVRTRRGVSFRHELARLAIAEETPADIALADHRALLGAYEAVGSLDHAVLAHHAVAAEDDERVVRYGRLAAEDAALAGAHSEAVSFLEQALARSTRPDRQRAELLELLGTELYMVSRLAEAGDAARSALAIREQLGDPDGVAAAHDRQAIIDYYSARRRDAEEQAALAAQAGAGPAKTASAEATRAYLAYRHLDLERAREILVRARDIVASAPDETDAARRRIEITEAAAALVQGRVSSRVHLLLQASAALDASFDEIGTTAYSNLSAIDIENRRLAEAEAVLAESIPVTIDRDIPICRQWQTGMRARLHFLRGRWTASGEDADAVIAEHGAPLALIWPHLLSGLLELRRGGDARVADRHLASAREHAERLDELPMTLAVLSAYAERAWHTGTVDPVLDSASEIVARADAVPGNAWAVGEVVVWLRRLARSANVPTHIADPYRLELDGRHDDASALWTELGAPFDAALSAVHSPSAEVARAGLSHLQQLDVAGTSARARLLLAERGIHSLPVQPRRATRSNPAGLTNRQLDVARLVAQGLTNGELAERLYISPKTADHHVSAVLGKLGLSSRREVMRSAVELGLV
jgi:DNA-binding CsgD family transcriptional regulator